MMRRPFKENSSAVGRPIHDGALCGTAGAESFSERPSQASAALKPFERIVSRCDTLVGGNDLSTSSFASNAISTSWASRRRRLDMTECAKEQIADRTRRKERNRPSSETDFRH